MFQAGLTYRALWEDPTEVLQAAVPACLYLECREEVMCRGCQVAGWGRGLGVAEPVAA